MIKRWAIVFDFLCAISVFSVSLWLKADLTTETQRTQTSHREEVYLQIRKPLRDTVTQLLWSGRKILTRIYKLIALEFVLLIVELPVTSVSGQKLLVRTSLDDLATFKHQNL